MKISFVEKRNPIFEVLGLVAATAYMFILYMQANYILSGIILTMVVYSLYYTLANIQDDYTLKDIIINPMDIGIIYYKNNKEEYLLINKSEIQNFCLEIELILRRRNNHYICKTQINVGDNTYTFKYSERFLKNTKKLFSIKDEIPNFTYILDKFIKPKDFIEYMQK